jgi:hypothetical protein
MVSRSHGVIEGVQITDGVTLSPATGLVLVLSGLFSKGERGEGQKHFDLCVGGRWMALHRLKAALKGRGPATTALPRQD